MCVFPALCRVAQLVSHLPFFHRADEFVKLVRENQVVIVAGETGSGKSTIAPLALLNSGLASGGKIGVTESRVVVTKRLAKWVSKLDGTYLGEVVGYQVGMDRQLDELVRLVYETEGIVLNQMLTSPKLGKYKILVIDEVHERTINVDVLMARLKKILDVRGDLRVVIMSATMDVHRFSEYFDGAPIMQVAGRTFPLEIRYAHGTPRDLEESIEWCADKVVEILQGDEPGDILCFLPDENSIKTMIRLLEKDLLPKAGVEEVRLLPLYGQQSEEEQDLAFVEEGPRRVILSTNIAETGVTVEGVVHVVDTGFIKQTMYISAKMSGLQIVEHSQAGVDQRAGRSARTQPGICHRLYTLRNYQSRVKFTEPEIRRSSLNQTLLDLRCGGISFEEIVALEFMDAPELKQWHEANQYLKILGAFDHDGNVTELGRKMHALHVDPMIAKIILEGVSRG